MRTLLVVAVLALALTGCQRAPAPTVSAPVQTVGSLTDRLKAEGDELMKQQRYEEAAVKYQAALNQAPGDIGIRFALAVALSHTSRREETITHFRVVVQRGEPGSVEVTTAREWLAAAGALDGSEPTATAAPPDPRAADPKKGRILGKIRWNDVNPHDRLVPITVSLVGDEVENRDVRLARPDFKIGRSYEFRNVPPGAYRLVAEAGGTSMWDLRVEVPAEKETTLDLTESNAAVPKDFVPRGD